MIKRLMLLPALGLLLAATVDHALARDIIRVHDVEREHYEELDAIGDFWGIDRDANAVIMAVDERQRAEVERLGFETSLDVERMRSREYYRSVDRRAWREAGRDGIPGYECYRTVDETKADLSAMASERPDLARWESIGDSWLDENGEPGGDDLYALVLGNQSSPHEQSPFILMAAQHARELTTAETAARFAEWLFDNYDTDPTARWLLDHREIHIIAQQNPDGRREVEDGASMWRKNVNLDACPGGTTGVDLNRNSNFFWGTFSDGNECGETYRGESEASEPETQAVQDYMHTVFENHWPGGSGDDPVPADADGLFISLHSFSELILFPWEGSGSGTANNAPNHDQLAWLGRKFGHFTGYEVGRDILYSAGGTMTDYAHGAFGVAAYTYEIGTDFQQSCGSFENDIIDDQLDSLIYAAKAAGRPYQAPSGPDILEPAARYNGQSGLLEISGLADGTRFDRGGVTEEPAADPIHDIAEIRASLDVPPDQAGEWFSIAPDASDPVSAFADQVDPSGSVDLPRLLFFQAVDSEGNSGVVEAVWITEQLAAIGPESISLSLPPGETGTEGVAIENVGSEAFTWSIAVDQPASLRDGHDPALDEQIALDDFTLPGDATHEATAGGGQATRGEVVGFSFEGTVSGITGEASWASDMALTVTSPAGASHAVGGYQSGNPDWDFQGSGSDDDGTYSSQHIGSDVFGADGTTDDGQWTFLFDHQWEDEMQWSDVSITLHKTEPPQCVDPTGVDWLSLDTSGGTLAPGESIDIGVSVDAGELAPGDYQALLCVTTDDPAAELTVITVDLTVLDGPAPTVFRDRFDATEQ